MRNPSERRIVNHAGNVVDLSFLTPEGTTSQYRTGGGPKPIRRRMGNTTDLSAVRRIDPNVLELAWMKDPISMTGVRMYQTLIEDAKANIFSKHGPTNKAIEDFLGVSEEFNNVFYEYVPLHIAVFGNAWVEHLMNRGKTHIGDFNAVDPLSMDFIREGDGFLEGKVNLDNYGREVGYRQEASTDGSPRIYYNRDQMSHLTLHQLRRGDRGIGFIEMMYGDINLKENVEQALTAQAYNSGFPKPVIQSGNERHMNNPLLENAAMRLAVDIVDNGVDWIVTPDGLEINKWQVEPIDEVSMEYLNLILQYQAGVFGIPLPFLLQSGDIGSGTMEVLMENFESMFRSFQKRMKLDKVLTRVLRFNGQPHKDIQVDYGRISERRFKEESLRLFRMLKTEAIDVSEPEVKSRIDEIAGIRRDKRDTGIPPSNG